MKQIQMVSIFRDSNGMRVGTMHSNIEGNKVISNNVRQSYVLIDPDQVELAKTILALGQALIEADE